MQKRQDMTVAGVKPALKLAQSREKDAPASENFSVHFCFNKYFGFHPKNYLPSVAMPGNPSV